MEGFERGGDEKERGNKSMNSFTLLSSQGVNPLGLYVFRHVHGLKIKGFYVSTITVTSMSTFASWLNPILIG